ncbi:ArsC family reductase [Aureimonas altamirensis]|uniref:ArsC family reductase n=1 Tax=Aureimonas altamirensis TaxID=370622 RepID=UPI0020374F98|nr:ArsC family reductase [Aureimonas altamirensis]
MTVSIYGIKNCDTMKKARAWLDSHGVSHVFHDYKIEPPEPARLQGWIDDLGWEAVLSRAGTTFRKLPDEAKSGLDAERAKALMLEQPSMIKRPMLEADGALLAGFSPAQYERLFL